MSKDRYRRVRRALRKIKEHIQWVEHAYPNRTQRRRALYEGDMLRALYENLTKEKQHVTPK